MSDFKIEDLRFSSSSIDDFLSDRPIQKVASSGRVRVSGMGDLSGFHFVAQDTLIHLSQKDFWKLGQDDNGHYIERLVDDSDGPIKDK